MFDFDFDELLKRLTNSAMAVIVTIVIAVIALTVGSC